MDSERRINKFGRNTSFINPSDNIFKKASGYWCSFYVLDCGRSCWVLGMAATAFSSARMALYWSGTMTAKCCDCSLLMASNINEYQTLVEVGVFILREDTNWREGRLPIFRPQLLPYNYSGGEGNREAHQKGKADRSAVLLLLRCSWSITQKHDQYLYLG